MSRERNTPCVSHCDSRACLSLQIGPFYPDSRRRRGVNIADAASRAFHSRPRCDSGLEIPTYRCETEEQESEGLRPKSTQLAGDRIKPSPVRLQRFFFFTSQGSSKSGMHATGRTQDHFWCQVDGNIEFNLLQIYWKAYWNKYINYLKSVISRLLCLRRRKVFSKSKWI